MAALPLESVTSWRWTAIWMRNALVWKKLALPSTLANFGDPMLYLFGIGWGLGSFVGEIEGVPYLQFFAAGLVCANVMNTASFEALYSAFMRMDVQRTWDGFLAAPLTVDDVVLGEAAWAASKGLLSGSTILLVSTLLGIVPPLGALSVLPYALVTGLCFASIAIFVTTMSPSFDFFVYYLTLAITPMFLFCGVFYPTSTLPPLAQDFAQSLPLTHAIALIRPPLTGLPAGAPWLHLAVLLGQSGLFLTLAIRRARRRFS